MSDDAHFALPHDVEPPVVASVLLKDLLAGGHPFHADAADIFFEFRLVELAAQIEQLRDETTRRTDRHVARDKGQRGLIAGDHRFDCGTGNE